MKLPLLAALFLASSGLAFAQGAGGRSLVLVFGPTTEEAGKLAAHSAAGTVVNWLKASGATAEVLRPGASEGQQLGKFMTPADTEKVLLDAARAGREGGLPAFLKALDKASYGLTRRPPGKRVLLAVVESPSVAAAESVRGGSEEVKSRLRQASDFCKAQSISVMVVDPAPPAEKDLGPDLEALATGTGGALVRDPNDLYAHVVKVAPEPVEKAESKPAEPAAPAGPRVPPVHVQLIRTYPTRVTAASDLAPMSGLLLVESPLSSLEFQTDDKAGTYLARARCTQSVRDAAGKAVWQQKKEITVKGPLRKMQERRAGNLYYLREVKLPGGQYTLEATVEDLISGRTGKGSEPLRASDSLPGFAVSDAVIVRKLDDSLDKFEADQVLSYDGKALAPMLDPVFPANQPLDLEIYFLIYPDLRGAKPEIGLEILRDGQVVGRSQLPFKDEIRNTATEGSALDSRGEQKHEFPYLATLISTYEAGMYEVHVTVRQDRRSITRVIPFRVSEGRGSPAPIGGLHGLSHARVKPATRLALTRNWSIPVLALFGGLPLFSQDAETRPRFDVVSVRRCDGTEPRSSLSSSPGRLSVPCFPLIRLIQDAFQIFAEGKSDFMNQPPAPTPIEGFPDKLSSDRYSIEAKAESPQSVGMMRGPMMQRLLEDRFHLKIRRDFRELPVYIMTVAKGGPKLQAAREGSCDHPDAADLPRCAITPPTRNGFHFVWDLSAISLGGFSKMLKIGGLPVIDRTGLSGRFDIHLEWEFRPPDAVSPESGAASEPPDTTIVSSIRRQLGLQLTPGKGPREFLVIDRLERPTEN